MNNIPPKHLVTFLNGLSEEDEAVRLARLREAEAKLAPLVERIRQLDPEPKQRPPEELLAEMRRLITMRNDT